MERKRTFGVLSGQYFIAEDRKQKAIALIHRSFRNPCEVNATTRRAYAQARRITEDEARREVLAWRLAEGST